MELLINDPKNQRLFNAGRRVGAVANPYALHRVNGRAHHTADNRTQAMIKVEECLARGSAVSMKNIAGKFQLVEIFVTCH
jgi:hypothetical protein